MKKTLLFNILLFGVVCNLNGQLVPCTDGMAGDYPCENVDLLAHLPIAEIGGITGAKANDIWGWTDADSGREFAIIGLTTGTSFVEITDPINPIYLGFLPTHSFNSSWRDMKTYDNKVYVVSEAGGHGIQVFDLTRLLNVVSPPVTFTEDDHHNSLGGSAHNIVGFPEIGYMILVGSGYNGCGNGFDLYSVSDNQIYYESCYGASGSSYTHDGMCFIYKGPDSAYVGREICIGSNGNRGGISTQVIIDITEKDAIQEISNTTYPNQRYSHQSWVTDDHRYIIFNDELDELDFSSISNTRTHMMDISDLDNPQYIGYYEHDVPTIDHNSYVQGQYIYESNYESGLRVLDLTNIQDSSLNLAAYFDTYIANSNSRHFNGAWSNYPFFESGTVAVSDIQGGLFLLRPNLPHFIIDVDENQNEICPSTSSITLPVSTKSMHGFSGMIDLNLNNTPLGINFSLRQSSFMAGNSTELTIQNISAPPGNYSVLLSGEAQGSLNNHDLAIYFKISQVSDFLSISDLNVSQDMVFRAHQSISLSNISIDSTARLEIIAPNLSLEGNVVLHGPGKLITTGQDGCNE